MRLNSRAFLYHFERVVPVWCFFRLSADLYQIIFCPVDNFHIQLLPKFYKILLTFLLKAIFGNLFFIPFAFNICTSLPQNCSSFTLVTFKSAYRYKSYHDTSQILNRKALFLDTSYFIIFLQNDH